MLTIDPKEVSIPTMHGYLLGAVAPRPIAFVSTIDKTGNINLSPFSFFNAFSANPPILIFSPSRRVRNNTTKHTLENVLDHPEAVINIVDFTIVEQMSLTSTEYDKGVNEFIKAGLTMEDSLKVKPPRVSESPAAFECKVNDVISLGEDGGAGNLIICEVLLAHFQQRILDENQRIDPNKVDVVARMGGDWYSRISSESLFEIAKPVKSKGIGMDQIPHTIKDSEILTGNDLGKLGNIERLPDQGSVQEYGKKQEIIDLRSECTDNSEKFTKRLHMKAQELLMERNVQDAWKTLLQSHDYS